MMRRHKRVRTCPPLNDDAAGFFLGDACLELNATETPKSSLFYLYAQSEECEQCDLWLHASIHGNTAGRFIVNSTFPSLIAVKDDTGKELCHLRHHFGQSGTYRLNINSNNTCSPLQVIQHPANIFLPLLWASLVLIGLLAVVKVGTTLVDKFLPSNWEDFSGSDQPPYRPMGSDDSATQRSERQPARVKPSSARLASLDCFRGMTIMIMIFVNYGGGQYWFFTHARWNGATVADLAFPWFMWIMGVSTFMSLESRRAKHFSKKSTFWKVLKRSIILFFLGLMINSMCWKNDVTKLRIPGVLQRFAVVYLVVAAIELLFQVPEGVTSWCEAMAVPWSYVGDILVSWKQWLTVIAITAVHTCLIFLLPVPGCPKGYLGPGGLHQHGKFSNCTGGATGYIDRMVFGTNHIYQNPTSKIIYNSSIPFDPEGLLGCLTSVLLVYLGVQAAKILKIYRSPNGEIGRLMAWALLSGVVCVILSKGTKNDGWIPINKNLWSLSYVFAMAGLAFTAISAMHYTIDVKQWWTGAPFIFAGKNPLLLYIGHEVTSGVFPWQFGPLPETHMANLFMNLWGVCAWTLVAFQLHRNKFYLAL